MPEMSRSPSHRADPALLAAAPSRIHVVAFGLSLGLLLAITFVLCVIFDLIFPEQSMHEAWMRFLPGFTWLTWPSFLWGLIESFAYGWYVALIFGPLYNFFAGRLR